MATIEHRSANTWRVGVRTSVEEGRRWIRQTLTFPASMPEAEQRRQAELAAARLLIDVEDGVIRDVRVLGGCSGNLKGICSLLRGMTVQDAIQRMDGIKCGMKPTSCPDQLAQALKQA